jgi:hypothetical protein
MSKLSNVGDAYALDYVTGRAVPYTAPRNTYLMLLTSPPTDQSTISTLVELSIGGYARQVMVWSAATGQPATTSNGASIVFGPFTFASAPIGWAALVSVSSGTTGDFLMWWSFNISQSLAVGQSLTIPANSLVMSLA